jgi:V8-like Glu-specific endopeptidase
MMHNSQVDFAIIRLDPAPQSHLDVEFGDGNQVGRRITILSHPEGMPLHWSQGCGLLVPEHPKTAPERLHYECDTMGGSSGAPIFDLTSAMVVGVHNGGWVDRNYGSDLNREPLNSILREVGLDH